MIKTIKVSVEILPLWGASFQCIWNSTVQRSLYLRMNGLTWSCLEAVVEVGVCCCPVCPNLRTLFSRGSDSRHCQIRTRLCHLFHRCWSDDAGASCVVCKVPSGVITNAKLLQFRLFLSVLSQSTSWPNLEFFLSGLEFYLSLRKRFKFEFSENCRVYRSYF